MKRWGKFGGSNRVDSLNSIRELTKFPCFGPSIRATAESDGGDVSFCLLDILGVLFGGFPFEVSQNRGQPFFPHGHRSWEQFVRAQEEQFLLKIWNRSFGGQNLE